MKSLFISYSARWLSLSLALGVLTFALPVNAQTGLHRFLTRQVRKVVSNGQAKMIGRLPISRSMHLEIVLPLRNQTRLNTLLKQLYDPSSPAFHHFLSVAQFTAQFGPALSQYETVSSWAKSNGFEVGVRPANNRLVPITGTVATIDSAFHVSMSLYKRPSGKGTFFSPDREPMVNVSAPILYVAGLDNYSIPHPMYVHRSTASGYSETSTGSGPDSSFLGSDMRAAYYGGTVLNGSGESVGLVEFLGTDLSDLNTYYSNIGQTNNVPIDLYSTDGTSTSCTENPNGCDDTEPTIDMTQALGMAPGLSRLVLYIGSTPAAILNAMASGYDGSLDYSLSSSWVWHNTSINQIEGFFKQFATQGQSFFQAAGDDGAWTASLLSEGDVYPADDPYVISVGGTDLTTNGPGGSWSSASAWASTGGGISPDDFPIPSWQTTLASTCTYCSQTYRNGPDVSANANQSFYVCADQAGCTANAVGGTSFAAPMWAGYVALANQDAQEGGGNTVGFIDPHLYSIGAGSDYGSDFHDITTGCNNTYCATTGYDLVTGLGSPNGINLICALTGVCPAATPYSSSSYSSTGGTDPTIIFTETLYDSTPGAEIFWTVPGCAGQTSGSDPVSSGGSFTLTYIVPYDCNPSGTMYATAPGYSNSTTTSIAFN